MSKPSHFCYVFKNQNELRLFLHWQRGVLILVERRRHLRLPGVEVGSQGDAEALLSVFRAGLENSLDSNIKTKILKTIFRLHLRGSGMNLRLKLLIC